MGNRASIIVESKQFATPIRLYGHWSGEDNLTAVKNVIERTDRVGDPDYLTAQLFYEFAIQLGNYDGRLSFGIGAYDDPLNIEEDTLAVIVNADTGKYHLEGE